MPPRPLLAALLVAPALALATTAHAAPYDDAIAAYDHAVATGNAADYTAALGLLQPEARAGNARASDLTGRLYRDGHGVARDLAEALAWFGRGAVQGDALAELDLGGLYASIAPPDRISAAMWLGLAANQGNADAAAAHAAMVQQMTPAEIAEADRRIRDWLPIAIN